MEKELRYIPADDWLKHGVRSEGGDEEKKAVGLGIVYDEWTELFPGFKERILRGAVKKDSVVKSFFNHDPSKVLSTTRSNPKLKLNDTDKGLEYSTPIPPTTYGKDLEINLERGNVGGSSFAFSITDNGVKTWEEDGIYHREISKLTLYEIGPVTDPAYLQTNANLRTAEDVYREMRDAQSQQAEADRKVEQQREASQRAAEARTRELQLLENEVNI